MDFADKVVLVTGSSSGIGAATAYEFAKLNCRLVIHGTDPDRIKQVANDCQKLSPRDYKPTTVQANFDCETAVETLLKVVIDKYDRLDVLVNNAGLFTNFSINDPKAYENYIKMMDLNINSIVKLTSLAVPHLKKTKGCIVNIASNLGLKPFNGTFAYSMAKAALLMFTKSMAIDLSPEIRVNSVSPGPVATGMCLRCGIDLDTYRKRVACDCLTERIGESNEIARAIVFLASPKSGYITGTDLLIDGGSLLKPLGTIMKREI